jgi:hypothetical protein
MRGKMNFFDYNEIACVSCGKVKPIKEIKYTQEKGERLALCSECWKSAIYVQDALRPENRADEARARWLRREVK